jgi:ferritin-like metal-binding protein YciE
MAVNALDDLFVHFLQDTYSAEKQMMAALPKMESAASNENLRTAFAKHRQETEQQAERLEQVFELIGKSPHADKCEAMAGLLVEGEEIVNEASSNEARDSGLIAAAQAVEHYEMARYGTLVDWAKKLGPPEVVRLLEESLAEEKAADSKLNNLAHSEVNESAA